MIFLGIKFGTFWEVFATLCCFVHWFRISEELAKWLESWWTRSSVYNVHHEQFERLPRVLEWNKMIKRPQIRYFSFIVFFFDIRWKSFWRFSSRQSIAGLFLLCSLFFYISISVEEFEKFWFSKSDIFPLRSSYYFLKHYFNTVKLIFNRMSLVWSNILLYCRSKIVLRYILT